MTPFGRRGEHMETAQVSGAASNAVADTGSYSAPHCRAIGPARGALFHPEGYSLWRVVGELGQGAALVWDAAHGDEAIYVESGALVFDGTVVGEGSTFIVEAGVPSRVDAVGTVGTALTRLVHFGTTATTSPADGMLGAPATDGRGVHVVRPEDADTIHFTGDATSVYFTDSTCPTCRIAFFLYDGSSFSEGYTGASHFHSEDEIIHMLEGELRVGPLSVVPGAAIAVPGTLRYSLRTPGPYRYLNYRADVSTAVVKPRSEPVLETVANLKGFGG
jgi:quercetin dioxygenase-like cupin family protein